MPISAALRVRLACSSEVFLREVAPRLRGRFWIQTALPATSGENLPLVVELDGATRHLRGLARIVSTEPNRLCVRLTELDPESLQFPLGADGPVIEDVLVPGVWHQAAAPAPVGDAKTPPHGTALQSLLADATKDEPEQKTSVYSGAERALVERTTPESQLPWSGGLQPLDTVGDFQLLERLGRSETAEVYVARHVRDVGLERLVAVKLMLPECGAEYGRLFLEGARTAASLQHDGLTNVFGFGEASGRVYMVTEYVRGRDLGTLGRCMAESGGASRPFALRVALEVAHALQYLHGRPPELVHRGISASNVLVSEKGEVRLVDFGVSAKHIAARRERRPPVPAEDIHATGVVLRDLLGSLVSTTAARATHREHEQRFVGAPQLVAALTAELADAGPVDVAMMVRALCGRSLASEKRRIADATKPRAAAAPAGPRAAPEPPRPRRSRAMLLLGLLLALAAAAVGWQLLLR